MTKVRLAVGIFSLSAAGFAALIAHEGFTSTAVVPIPGDRPTLGFGSTFKVDGAPVKMGDTIAPPAAIRLSVTHIAKDETVLRKCVTGAVSQAEWDVLVNFSYWRGAAGTCRGPVVAAINAGRYAEACAAYLTLDGRKAAGKDCAVPANKCRGVWMRAQERHATCMAAQ
jgi:GH24 family phage-related lysozyme (muramidase)